MSDADQKKIPQWSDITASQDFQDADWETRQAVRARYFDRVVRPNTPANLTEEVQGQFMTRTEPDVFGDREEDTEAPAEDFSYRGARNDRRALEERERVGPGGADGEVGQRSVQNTLNRGTDLMGGVPKILGRAVEGGEAFLDRTFGRGGGIIGGEIEAMRERGYEPDVSLGGYGLDFTSRADPEDTSLGLERAGQAIQDTGREVENTYTPERFIEDPSLANAGGMVVEQGPAAAVDMAAMAINLPGYMLARTQEIAEERAGNQKRERPVFDDYLAAGPTAAASVAVDRLALDRLLPGSGRAITRMRQVPGAAARGTATEAATEALQEGGIEYAGSTVGTEQGWDAREAGTSAVGGAIIGGPVGGGVSGVSATIEATREQAARAGGDALQQTLAGQQAEQQALGDQSARQEAGRQADQEAITAASELVRRPRTLLSDAEREARDSITHGEGFQALRAMAEQRGDTEAVAELDAIREEAGVALEEETLAATQGDQDGMARVQQRLSGTGDRLARVMERINNPEAQSSAASTTVTEIDGQRSVRRQAPQGAPGDLPTQSPAEPQEGLLSGAMGSTRPQAWPYPMQEPTDTGLPGFDAGALDVNQEAAGEPQGRPASTGERQDRQATLKPLDEDGSYAVMDEEGNQVGWTTVSTSPNGDYLSLGPDITEGQGYGRAAYLAASEMNPGLPVRSGAELSPQAEAMWERMVRDGVATRQQVGTLSNGEAEYSYTIPSFNDRVSQAERLAPQSRQPDSDGLLRKSDGTPFSTERSARASRPFKENPGAVIEPLEGGGFAIRPAQAEGQESAPASDVRGEPIDDEWTAFADDSGTRGVPRASMPQVRAEHRGALANFLNARGIESAEDNVPSGSLSPTQAEFSEAKVQQAKERTGGDRAILVSSDGHILDGHHQWMARRDQGEDVRVIRLDAPIDQLVDEIQAFPSSELEGEQEADQDAEEEAVAEQDAAQDDTRYRQPADGEMTYGAVERMIRPLRAEGIMVEVAPDESALPKPLRDKIRRDGVEGMVAGVYYNRTTWLIAGNLRTPKQVMETVLHETIGHQGVMQVLGSDLNRVMDNIYRDMPARTRRELEDRYAGQLRHQSPEQARRTVAEEHVAHLAETDPQSSVLDRVISAVRMALRRLFGPSAAREWGRKEVVDLIAQARGAMAGRGRPEGESRYRLKHPVHLEDGSRLSGFNDGASRQVFYGYDRNGEPFTLRRDRVRPEDITWSRDGNRTADSIRSALESDASSEPRYSVAPPTDSPAFKRWFGDSKVVDESGDPLVLYHGSSQKLDVIEPGYDEPGAWFTTSRTTASSYAKGDDAYMHDVYLRSTNPLEADFSDWEPGDSIEIDGKEFEDNVAIVKHAERSGYDAVHFPIGNFSEDDETWVVFDSNQVKSVDNEGTFDPENPDVRYALKPKKVTPEAIQEIGDAAALDQTMPFAQAGEYSNNRALKLDLQERVKAAAKRHKVDLEAVNTEIEKVLTETGVRDAKEALKSNANAVGWYDETVSKAMEIVSLIHPEIRTDERSRFAFTYALAVTSNGIKVDKNFQLAEQAYRDFKRDGVMPTNIQAGQAQKSINDSMALFNELRERFGDDTFRDFMLSEFTVAQLNRMGFKITGEQAATRVRGAAILGPKIGNGFFSNLYGHFDALTMDRWLMRTWGRWTGTLIDARPDMVKTKRAELKAAVREIRQDKAATKAFEKALGAKLQLTSMDYLAQRIQRASVSPEVRQAFNETPAGETIRKAGNGLANYLDGQKEAPRNGKERNWIRQVFGNVLERLRGDGYEQLTMSDLQALLWYPERRLYDMAKGDEDVEAGYADDEAPDYANAAADLARDNGVPEADIQRAIEEVTGDATEGRSARAGRSDRGEPAASEADEARGRRASEERDRRGLGRAERSRLLKREVFVAARLGRGRDADARSFSRASGGRDQEVRGLVARFKPLPKLRNILRDAELGSVELEELSPTDENIQRFSDAITASKEASEYGAAVHVYPQDEYREMRLFMTPDGGSGMAIKPDGDIVSIYTDGGAKVHAMLTLAVEQGGTKLDAFETVLPNLYKVNGFKEIGRDPWSEQHRPEGWDKAVFQRYNNGEPDVVYMAYDPDYNPYYDGEGEPRYSLNGETDEGRPESTRDRGGRDRGRGPAPLAGAPEGSSRQGKGPDAELNRTAERYAEQHGIDLRRQTEYVEVDVELAQRIAQAYEEMEHDPQDPRVQEAYQDLIRQTKDQYQALVDAGYEFSFFDGETDPYGGNPWEAMRDIRNNKRMAVYGTYDGYGTDGITGAAIEENPMLEDTGLEWPDQNGVMRPVTANDLFRAVHDAFGHGLEGAGFRARGEENAWQAHVRLFHGPAVGALTAETRGQNSWLNYGPYGETNQTAGIEDTIFAEQKVGLLPEWTWTEGRADDMEAGQGDMEALYPEAGDAVSGLRLRDPGNVPNMGSIRSTLDDYTVLPGIRQVPVSAFDSIAASDMFYAKSDRDRVRSLTEEIRQSGEISPLIVVHDAEGAYILEGGHRAASLDALGVDALPAVVVIDNETDSDDIRYSLNEPEGGPYTQGDSTNFAMPDETYTDVFLRNIADKFRSVKRLQQAITRSGGRINDDNDTYLAEELYYGKTETDLRRLEKEYIKPLVEGLARAKIAQADLDTFLYARHAPERNLRIAERNPDNEAMQDGGSGMTDAQAEQVMEIIDRSGKREAFERLAGIVDEMLAVRREAIRDGGLMSDEMLDVVMTGFDHYVPLKGWARDEDVPVGEEGSGRPATGRGFEASGKESKIALGRRTVAASPSTQAIVDTTEALIKRRKNEVAQALLSLVTDNPNPQLWQVFTQDNPDMEAQPVRRVDPETGRRRTVAQQMPVPMAMSDRYFKAKKNGETYFIRIHHQQLMDALRNVGTSNAGAIIEHMASVVRVMSSLVTSYNPEFMVNNFIRDAQTALLNIQAEQSRDDGRLLGKKIGWAVARDMRKAMRAAYRGLTGKPSREGEAGEWDRWFEEFMEAGGKTGYFDTKDVERQARDLQRMMSMAQGGTMGNARKAARTITDFVENMNGAVENAVRLSAYANARRHGLTRKRAASMAKNMTVNFNRRGEMSTTLGAMYMFFNAAVQGTANFVRTMGGLKDPAPGRSRANVWSRLNTAQKLAVGMTAGAFLNAILQRMLSDEDDDEVKFWDKVPDFEKERNLVFMTGWATGDPKDYVKLPLPYGYNVFSVMGTQAEAVAFGGKDATDAGVDLTLALLGSFNPIGFEDSEEASSLLLKNAAPTLIRSVAQVGVNEDFAGRMIYKENLPFGTPLPDSSLAFRSTPEAYQSITGFLNRLSGGNAFETGAVDISPDVLQHVVNFYGGGAWSFSEKVADAGVRTFTGEEIKPYRRPFLGRVMGEADDEYDDQSRFYERRDQLGQRVNYIESLEGSERRRASREERDVMRMFSRAKNLQQRLSELRKLRDRAEQSEQMPEARREALVEQYESRMKERIDEFNLAYDQAFGEG